jgi:hypothetical protein
MATPDWEDPCAVLNWILPQLYRVASGLHQVSVRHGDTTRVFSQANVRELRGVIAELRAACAARQGSKLPVAGLAGFSRGDS